MWHFWCVAVYHIIHIIVISWAGRYSTTVYGSMKKHSARWLYFLFWSHWCLSTYCCCSVLWLLCILFGKMNLIREGFVIWVSYSFQVFHIPYYTYSVSRHSCVNMCLYDILLLIYTLAKQNMSWVMTDFWLKFLDGKKAPWLHTILSMSEDDPHQCPMGNCFIRNVLVEQMLKGQLLLHLTLWLLKDVCCANKGSLPQSIRQWCCWVKCLQQKLFAWYWGDNWPNIPAH